MRKKRNKSKFEQRIETIEGLPLNEALRILYVENGMTYRMLCRRWNCQPHTIINYMKKYGIPPRKGSDAIKQQWINNPSRKIKAAKRLASINHNLALKGLHVRQGKNKYNSELIRSISEKLKFSSSFLNPETIIKATKTRVNNFRNNPLTHPNANASMTNCEHVVFEHLESIGYNVVFNYYLDPYWIDIFIPELNIAIECVSSSRFPLSFERHDNITSKGITVIYCVNYYILKSDLVILDKYIHFFNIFRSNPPVDSKVSVVIGRRDGVIFSRNIDHLTSKIVFMHGFNSLLFSTTPNYDVANINITDIFPSI
jgi:hypothetical protein